MNRDIVKIFEGERSLEGTKKIAWEIERVKDRENGWLVKVSYQIMGTDKNNETSVLHLWFLSNFSAIFQP